RSLMWTQLIGIPVGAAALAIVYPALRDTYGFEGARALTSPISVKWAGFAELLSSGFSMLPHGSLTALGIALVAGVVLTVLEPRWHRFLPSTTAMGIGMLIPGTATLSMVLGGVAMWLWSKRSPETEAVYNMPLASGFIDGEALVVLVIAVVAAARSFAG